MFGIPSAQGKSMDSVPDRITAEVSEAALNRRIAVYVAGGMSQEEATASAQMELLSQAVAAEREAKQPKRKKRPPNIDPYDYLAQNVPADRKASQVEVIRWVFCNIKCNPDEINPDDVPNRGAVTMLQAVDADEISYKDFIQIWAKTIPAKLDESKESRDDGTGKIFEAMDRVEEELRERFSENKDDNVQEVPHRQAG